MSSELEIRSFRAVFALERRIYRIDTLRLNPGGVPVRGIVYAIALVLLALVAGAVPPTSLLDAVIPWYARDLGIPMALAVMLGSLRLDGRPVHLAASAIGEFAFGPRHLHRLGAAPRRRQWEPPQILLIPDGSDARFRSLRFRGPGAVLVAVPHVRALPSALSRADLALHQLDGPAVSPTALELARGAVLLVRPS